MITVQEAKNLILQNQKQARAEDVLLLEAVGLILSEDVYAQVDSPAFDSSAMDGFALKYEEIEKASPDFSIELNIVDEIWAGKQNQKKISSGECAKIMTGAKVPLGANAIVMKEVVEVAGDQLRITQAAKLHENIRKQAEEIQKGDLILRKNHRLSAGVIGLLASQGYTHAKVYPHPKVVIIPTGSELVSPGEKLGEAQIYESNSYALAAALKEIGVTAKICPALHDERETLHQHISESLKEATHVLISGGVSVGDYDLNKSILGDLNVKEVFWKIAQKPGKPLFFGVHENVSVFGLPGNPVSSLLCFYEYVWPAIEHYRHALNSEKELFQEQEAVLKSPVKKAKGKTHFIRGLVKKEKGGLCVEPLQKQQSHMMSSFAETNCLIVAEAEREDLKIGEKVLIHLLP